MITIEQKVYGLLWRESRLTSDHKLAQVRRNLLANFKPGEQRAAIEWAVTTFGPAEEFTGIA